MPASFKRFSCFTVVAFAMLFMPTVAPAIDPDEYEDDNTFSCARIIEIDTNRIGETPQHHNFHEEDQDWGKFYALSEEEYTIRALNLEANCNIVLELYDRSGTNRLELQDSLSHPQADEELVWKCPINGDGVYFVLARHYFQQVFGDGTGYDIEIEKVVAPIPGNIQGSATDSATGAYIGNALIKTVEKGSAISEPKDGFFRILNNPAGSNQEINAQAVGYQKYTSSVDVPEDNTVTKDIRMISLYEKGDINGNGFVNLEDILLALQSVTGMTPSQAVYTSTEVSGDGQIGVEEAIYVLQKTAALR